MRRGEHLGVLVVGAAKSCYRHREVDRLDLARELRVDQDVLGCLDLTLFDRREVGLGQHADDGLCLLFSVPLDQRRDARHGDGIAHAVLLPRVRAGLQHPDA